MDLSPTSRVLSFLLSHVCGIKDAPITGFSQTELCTASGVGEDGSNRYTVTEIPCHYSTEELMEPGHQLAVIQRWSAYTVEPVYSGHPWDTTSWLLYRGGLLIQWNLYIVVTLETQPVGYYTEVVCLYSGTCI